MLGCLPRLNCVLALLVCRRPCTVSGALCLSCRHHVTCCCARSAQLPLPTACPFLPSLPQTSSLSLTASLSHTPCLQVSGLMAPLTYVMALSLAVACYNAAAEVRGRSLLPAALPHCLSAREG